MTDNSPGSQPSRPASLNRHLRLGRLRRSERRYSGKIRVGVSPGTMLGDRYRVLGLIGRGGMGEIIASDLPAHRKPAAG